MDGYRLEDKEPWLTTDRKRTFMGLLLSFGLFVALTQVTTKEKAVACTGAIWCFYAILSVYWNCRGEVWFWVTVAIFASAHIAAIALFSFQLPRGPTLTYVVPGMFIDGFAMFGVLKLLASKLSVEGRRSS